MKLSYKKIIFFIVGLSSLNAFVLDQSNTCPLVCGAFDLQVQAGIAPIIFHTKDQVKTGTPFFSQTTPVLLLFNGPHFHKLFHIPWIVGMQLGYAYSDSIRLYGEINYLQAQGRKAVTIISQTTPAIESLVSLRKFHLMDAYVGGRYYFNRWCDYLSFFVGGKLGFTRHFSTNSDLVIANTPTDSTFEGVPFFKKNFNASGGFNVGIDICFCTNWSFVVTGEVVISAAPAIDSDNFLNPTIMSRFNQLSFGHLSTEFRFPITAALRYSF